MSRVLCNRCKRMMVPRVIFSRSIAGGWGWRIGGGKPISSCCPFCLSEHWDVVVEPSPLRGSVLMKVLSIPLTLIMFSYHLMSTLRSAKRPFRRRNSPCGGK